MPRPRFAALEPARRDAILGAAADELAHRGLEGASYNRIIERSGVSKGAMYYYFDGKDDLCLTALRRAFDRAVAHIGPPSRADDAHGFWDALAVVYERILGFVAEEPALAGLLRAVLVSPSARVDAAIAEYTEQARSWLERLLEDGRALGAVRGDLPGDLLTRLLISMGDCTDRWLLERWDELEPAFVERYALTMLELHMRVAAPLALVIERERRAR